MITITQQIAGWLIGKYNKKEFQLSSIFEMEVPKGVMLSTYRMLVNDQAMPAIETLPEEKKKELEIECQATGSSFTDESLTNAAKILHTIKFINDNT